MQGVGKLKDKILKLNSVSIFVIIILFSLLSAVSVYFILNASLKKEIEFIKNDYSYTQKTLVKNQVDKFVNYLKNISKNEKERFLFRLQESVEFISHILEKQPQSNYVYILNELSIKYPNFIIALSDINGNKIFANFNGYDQYKREQFIKKLKKNAQSKGFFVFKTKKGEIYVSGKIFKSLINGKKYFLTEAILESAIYQSVKNSVKKFIHTINSVLPDEKLVIIKVINENGTYKGKYIINTYDRNKEEKVFVLKSNDLKALNGGGYLEIKKRGAGKIISYSYFYKPFNWIIIGYRDLKNVSNFVKQREIIIRKEMKSIFIMYALILLVFLIIVYFITKYENRIMSEIIKRYEKEISYKNIRLKKLNDNLQQEVIKKTNELIDTLFTDPLTKLPNREKLINDMESFKYVAVLNIDSFKDINDFYGFEIGDEVLKKIAEKLRKYENIYKLSADEFAVLDNDSDNLIKTVNKIIKKIESEKIKIGNVEIDITLKAGIGENLSEADLALKYLKESKTDKILIYNKNLPFVKEYQNNIKWKNILKEVIKNNSVIPHAQAIVESKTLKPGKYECLIRIEYDGKIHSPYHFLEISKKTGQYLDLQKIMIDKCFEFFKDKDIKFSINLSAYELSNIKFREFLLNKIDEFNIADKLIIELLEDEKLHNEELMGFLMFLHHLDVEFAIDDFGSGYSNLSYLLSKLPVSTLKIDGSLIKNIEKNHNNYKLVKALISMAKIFNLSVVAEYVENERIAEILKDLGVDYMQGYYFAKPVPFEELNI